MQGRVVYLIRPGQHGDLGHPNAILLQLSADQYLCVAGFTPGKFNYIEAEKAEHSRGIWQHEFAIEIDHRTQLIRSSTTPIELHVCGYIFQTAQVLSGKELQAGRDWGMLPDSEIRRIAEGLLAREAKQSFLPKVAVRLLKKFLGR